MAGVQWLFIGIENTIEMNFFIIIPNRLTAKLKVVLDKLQLNNKTMFIYILALISIPFNT